MSAADQSSSFSAQCYSYRPIPSSLPTSVIHTITLGDDEVETNLVLQLFSDRIFISVTQLSGKVGSLLFCNVEESIVDNSTTYDVKTLLGTGVSRSSIGKGSEREISIRDVFVRRLSERIVFHTRKMAGSLMNNPTGWVHDLKGNWYPTCFPACLARCTPFVFDRDSKHTC